MLTEQSTFHDPHLEQLQWDSTPQAEHLQTRFLQAGLDEPGSYDRAVAGCDCVIHMASPLMFVKAGQVCDRCPILRHWSCVPTDP